MASVNMSRFAGDLRGICKIDARFVILKDDGGVLLGEADVAEEVTKGFNLLANFSKGDIFSFHATSGYARLLGTGMAVNRS